MTGPQYPSVAVAGSFNVWATIISQYANSPILTQLITNFAQYLDQTANFEAFYDLMWNIDTAQGYGLDVWGRIVGVTRTLQLAGGGRFLGFEEAGGLTVDPFDQSPFYAGATVTNNFQLSDDAFRVLIFAKALSNISNGTIPSINQILLNLFPGRGNAYVTDGTTFNSGGNDANTVLLIHCDGTLGSTTFTDSSASANVVTASGGASVATDQVKFGSGSARFDGTTTNFLFIPDASYLRPAGDYTIDFWVYLTSIGVESDILSHGNGFSPYLILQLSGNWYFFASSSGASWDIANGLPFGVAAANGWHHIAISRSGNNYFGFVDGVSGLGAVSSALVPNQTPSQMTIGARLSGAGTNGYIDELRFSNIARWTANFTPPVNPYGQIIRNNMTMTYTFEFTLTQVEAAIILQSGVLPKPVGVAATIVQL